MTAHKTSMGRSKEATGDPAPAAPARSDEGGEWLACAVIFAILGGCLALWFIDLSLITGTVAALLSGLAGVLFSEI